MSKILFIPSNQLTFNTVQSDVKRLFERLRNNKETSLCLDLRAVTQCDSAGLALLIEAKRLCKKHNKAFEIVGMSKAIQALAEFCGVESILMQS